MSLSKDQQDESSVMLPRAWNPACRQASACSVIDNKAQESSDQPSGESTPSNTEEAIKSKQSNRRRRQREHRRLKRQSLKLNSQSNQELEQEVQSQEQGRD